VDNINDALWYSEVCACWLPWGLINYNSTVWKEVCSDFLSSYEYDGESYFHGLWLGTKHWYITLNCNEMAVIVDCHHPTSQTKKFKATLSAGKVMDTIFWDAEGVILVDNTMWSNNKLRRVHFLCYSYCAFSYIQYINQQNALSKIQ
jgi:hypothetical protein